MPFKSNAQRKLCYLLKNKGQAGSWDCSEWSEATGKKKLPEHVKDQTEKEALEAVIKLARCWAGYEPVPGKKPFSNDSCRPKAKSKKSTKEEKKAELHSLFSKMSSVITSPGRGAGDDEEDTAINPDSSDGMPKIKPAKPALGQKGLKPASPMGAARNAVRRATESTFGVDPASGIKQASEFDFSMLGAKLDPSILGTAPARGFDFSNMRQSLQNVGRQTGKAITSGVENWVKAPGITSPMEVWRRRNQAMAAQKALGSATDSAGRLISGFTSAGKTLLGMGKQANPTQPSAPAAPKAAPQAAPAPAASSNNANALRGAASGVGDAFRAGFGNQDAFKRVQDDFNRPNYSQLNNTAEALGSIGSNAFGGIANTARYAGQLAKARYNSAPAASYVNFGLKNINLLPKFLEANNNINNFTERLSGSYANAKTEAANSEGRRMAAGATMPVLNFMQNNPWAKYLMGALGVGAIGYGASRLFGGQQQEQQPQAGSAFQRSYDQGLLRSKVEGGMV